jgi:hypothetical protein
MGKSRRPARNLLYTNVSWLTGGNGCRTAVNRGIFGSRPCSVSLPGRLGPVAVMTESTPFYSYGLAEDSPGLESPGLTSFEVYVFSILYTGKIVYPAFGAASHRWRTNLLHWRAVKEVLQQKTGHERTRQKDPAPAADRAQKKSQTESQYEAYIVYRERRRSGAR